MGQQRPRQVWNSTQKKYLSFLHSSKSGPSCSKLTTSLVNDSLKFTSSDTQICWNFVAFALQKLLTFFQQKNIRILCIEFAKTDNEMTLNKLVKLTKLWTTGPCILCLMKSKTTPNSYKLDHFLYPATWEWWWYVFLAHLSYAQDKLLWSLFVRLLSVCRLTFSNDFSSEAAEPILLKFHT